MPNCDLCDAAALYKREYQHSNGERYWMNVCRFCSFKNADFQVQS
jgi:hypothetical protein